MAPFSWLAHPLPSSSSSAAASSSGKPKKPRDRRVPKGLWRARVTVSTPRCHSHHQGEASTSSSTTSTSKAAVSTLSTALGRLYHREHSDSWSDTDESVGQDETEEGGENDLDHGDSDTHSTTSSSSHSHKKRRLSLSDTDSDEIVYWDFSRQCSPLPSQLLQQVPPHRESSWTRRTRIMDTSSLAIRGTQTESKSTCDYEDWEDLKDLFAKAVEQYERDDASEALPLIRGVVHECHRFLLFYQDPSVLFTNPANIPNSPYNLTPPEERLARDWNAPSTSAAHPSTSTPTSQPQPQPFFPRSPELPTAFHAILGTAFFLFGNLIAADPTLALPGEPNSPTPYWLAALDVFETGENLPSKTSGRAGAENWPEDWRMAIVWGRTLVCIADERINRARQVKASSSSSMSMTSGPGFSNDPYTDEPNWPPESPFSIIAKRRPPITRRMSLASASAHDLMKLAMDQFSRGIFHMPHPQHSRGSPTHYHVPKPQATSLPLAAATSASTTAPVAGSTTGSTPGSRHPSGSISAPQPPAVAYNYSDPLTSSTFSRAKELFTIASEVLLLADKLENPDERAYWASWADSVFNQMKMEMEGELERDFMMQPVPDHGHGGKGKDKDTATGITTRVSGGFSWREAINRSRGQAMLIVGTARAEEFEEALVKYTEGGKGAEEALQFLRGEEAEEAREALAEAVGFFEKLLVPKTEGETSTATSSSKAHRRDAMDADEHDLEDGSAEVGEEEELKRMLCETLLTLANLTLDEEKREELYKRVEKEGGMSLSSGSASNHGDDGMEVDS